jgi:hypothetical protein
MTVLAGRVRASFGSFFGAWFGAAFGPFSSSQLPARKSCIRVTFRESSCGDISIYVVTLGCRR